MHATRTTRRPVSCRAAAIAAAVLVSAPSLTVAADLTWDADPATPGIQIATGTWDLTTANWLNASSVNGSWANGNTPVFGAGATSFPTGVTVTLAQPVTVAGMTFALTSSATPPLTITSSQINLSAGANVFNATGNQLGLINSTIAGAGSITKTGALGIMLGGANTYSGGTRIEQGATSNSGSGAIRLTNGNALGTGAVDIINTGYTPLRFDLGDGVVPNAINLPTSQGTSTSNQTNFVTTASTIDATGVVTLRQSPNLTGKVSGGYAGLTLFLNLASSAADGGVVFSNPNNDFTARLQLNRGKIGVGATGALGNPGNLLVLDVTRNGASNAGIGLHFTAPNVTVVNPIEFRDQTNINVNGNNGSVISGTITSGTNQSNPNSILGGQLVGDTSVGSLRLAGANSFDHAMEVLDNTRLIADSPTALGSTFRGVFVRTGGTLVINAGLDYNNDEFGFGGELVNATGDGALAAGSRIGALQLQNGSRFQGRLVMNGDGSAGVPAGATGTLAGSVTESIGGRRSFSKLGAGTLVFDATGSYTGPTLVRAGTLKVGSGSLPNTPIDISSGATLDVGTSFATGVGQNIQGTGTVAGNLTVGAGSQITGGAVSTAGTIAVNGNLTLAGGVVRADITAPGGALAGNDLIAVNGNLALTGVTDVVASVLSGGSLVNGTYQIASYTGTLTGNPATALQLDGAAPGTTRPTITFNAGAGALNLVVSGGSPTASLTWTGANGNSWDVIGANNWSASGSPAQFYNLDSVTFGDGGANTSITLNATVSPGAVVVNGAQNYSFAGTGAIAGGTGIVKNGTGTLTLNTSNRFRGAVVVNGGTLSINSVANAGQPSAIGAASSSPDNLVLNAGTTLRYTGETPGSTDRGASLSGNVTVDVANASLRFDGPVVQGSAVASLTKAGTGTLIFGGEASYVGSPATGTTTVSAGTLQVGDNTETGSLIGNVSVASGASLALSRSNAYAFAGVVSGSGQLVKRGDGATTLSGVNTYSGGTLVETGELVLTGGSSAGTGPITINSGASLSFLVANGSSNTTYANDIVLPGSASQQFILRTTPTINTPTTVTLTGKISGGGPGIWRLSDTGIGGNHNNRMRWTNVNNDFIGTIELWRGALIVTDDRVLGNPDNDIRHYVENDNGGLWFEGPNVVLNAQRDIQILGSPPAAFRADGTNKGTILGVISSAEGTGASVDKQGTGTLVLAGANTYNVPTNVVAGTLLVTNTSGSGTGTGNVNVAANATFGGTGSIAGSVNLNGAGSKVAPGVDGAGVLTIGTELAQANADSTIAIQLGGSGAGQSDRLDVTGAATLGGKLSVSLLGGFVSLPGTSYEVLRYASRTGDVTIVNDTGYAGLRYTKTFNVTSLTLTATAFPGDANLDNVVNFDDLLKLAASYNQSGKNWLSGDFTSDGTVNFDDLLALAANYNKTGPAGLLGGDWALAQTAVPEPTAITVVGVAAAAALRRRRR